MNGTHVAGRIGLVMVGLGLGVLAGEITLRTFAAANEPFRRGFTAFDPLAASIEPHGEIGFRQRPNREFEYFNDTHATSNEQGFRGPTVSPEKAPGTFRVILLGGSTTHGWGVNDDETIDVAMRQQLHEAFPLVPVEVINLAFDGYDSFQLFERLRSDGLRLQPDLVIVNSGVNDVRNARFANLRDRDPRTILWAAELRRLKEDAQRGGASTWSRLKHYSYFARFPGFARFQWHRGREARSPVEIVAHDEAADYFERNLVRIADLVADRRIPVIFSTPPSDLPTWADTATDRRSYWLENAAATQAYRSRLAERMEAVVARLEARGQPATYLRPELPSDLFLDDCHLTPRGNQRIARHFANAVLPYLQAARGTDHADAARRAARTGT